MVGENKEDTQQIYLVTTLEIEPENVKRSRCVGYFFELEYAIKCIEMNWGDIYENGYYSYAVIEKVNPGIYQYDNKGIWYKWHRGWRKYRQIEKPEELKHVVGFGIG